jgi:hypothetical protein
MATGMLDSERLGELLRLLTATDTVELKLTVPDTDIRSTVRSLGMDPLAAEIRQVVFLDTPDLALSEAGVVVRARRRQRGAGDTVVKLRPVDPNTLSAEMRLSPALNVEVDAMPGGFVCSASMKGVTKAADIWKVMRGERQPGKLFTKEQKAFYKQHAPEGLRMDDLMLLGPLTILKLRFEPEELGRRMVAELWLYPDGARILELSTKCEPTEAFQVAAETRGYLEGRGVQVGGEQQTKTKTALEYFSGLARIGA